MSIPAAWRGWIDDRFGALGGLRRFRSAAPEPAWWHCEGELARFPAGNRFSLGHVACAGSSLDPDEALWRALGEGVERYCALNADPGGIPMTLRQAGLADRWPRCAADEPCPPSLRDLPLDTPITHIRMRHLADDREALVPAGWARLTYQRPTAEPPVAEPISTGLAFARDLRAALWVGLCEVAERDAIMGMWWGRMPVPEIVCAGPLIPGQVAERLDRLAAAGLRARLFDMTTDFRVPSVFCVVTGERPPRLTVGAACQADPARACAKALDEAVALRRALGVLRRAGTPTPDGAAEVHRLEDHALFYADHPNHPALAFLLARDRPVRIAYDEFAARDWWETPGDLPALASFAVRLRQVGLTALWANLTLPDVGDLGRVVKVIVPEMVPLSPDHAIRWLGTPRLRRRAGPAAPGAAGFNPFPHPFP